jgi:hypothetical protein
MSCIQKKAIGDTVPIISLLLLVHICGRGNHLSLVMNGLKVTQEGQVWVPAACQMVWLVYIDHMLCPVFGKRPLIQCPELCCCCMLIFDTDAIICY